MDFRIRAAGMADAEAIADVHVNAWRESYRGIVPPGVLESLSIPERTQKWRQILSDAPNTVQSTFIAEQQGGVVGFVNGGSCRSELLGQDMELYAIYLRDRVKRCGMGTALLKALFQAFASEGGISAGVWVLHDNHPARAFYEKHGALLFAGRTEHRPGYDLMEVGYSWCDIRILQGQRVEKLP